MEVASTMNHDALNKIRPGLVFALLACFAAPLAADGNWPSFRGPGARGVADGHPTAMTWNVPEGRGVRWQTEIPGLGHSCPVIWGDRLFVTTAVARWGDSEVRAGDYGDPGSADDQGPHSFRLFCLDKTDGTVLWQKIAYEGRPKAERHMKSSHANPTVATDGKRVIAFFGPIGLYAYTMDGELLWRKDLGLVPTDSDESTGAGFGFASSPILHQGRVIIQGDIVGDSFLAVFDARDGREIWRQERADVPTWSTPTIVPRPGRDLQIVVNGFKHKGGYDLETGEELWQLLGGGDVPIPTPFMAHGLIFLANGHGRSSPVYAVRPDAAGDITIYDDSTSSEHIAWKNPRIASYQNTPIVYGDELYVCRDSGGRLFCLDALTGEEHYRERLAAGANFVASPVAADGKLYFTSESGEVYVVKAGKSFERLAVNPLGETTLATPAVSEGVLYFRTRHRVIAIGKTP